MTISTPMHADLHATLGDMVAIQVRDVPEGIRDDLAREARAQGMSLQAFLREVLEREARRARNAEFLRTFEPIKGTPQPGTKPADIVKLIEEGRAERDRRIMDALDGLGER